MDIGLLVLQSTEKLLCDFKYVQMPRLMVACFSWSQFPSTMESALISSWCFILCKDIIDPSCPQLIQLQGYFSPMNFYSSSCKTANGKVLHCFHVPCGSGIPITKTCQVLQDLACIYEPEKSYSFIPDQKQMKENASTKICHHFKAVGTRERNERVWHSHPIAI